MAAKMVGKPYRKDTRDDWNDVRVDIMGWCIRAKMAQNFIKFGTLLEKTINKKIVEDSHKDDFWGAISDNNSKTLTGENFLGRLLMKVRKIYFSDRKYTLLKVEPLKIPNFNLYSDPISQIDSRKQFCEEIMRISDEKKEVFPKGKSQFGLWDE